MKQKIKTIVISYKDRFVRFGYDWFYRFCEKFNTEIIVVNNEKQIKEDSNIVKEF